MDEGSARCRSYALFEPGGPEVVTATPSGARSASTPRPSGNYASTPNSSMPDARRSLLLSTNDDACGEGVSGLALTNVMVAVGVGPVACLGLPVLAFLGDVAKERWLAGWLIGWLAGFFESGDVDVDGTRMSCVSSPPPPTSSYVSATFSLCLAIVSRAHFPLPPQHPPTHQTDRHARTRAQPSSNRLRRPVHRQTSALPPFVRPLGWAGLGCAGCAQQAAARAPQRQ